MFSFELHYDQSICKIVLLISETKVVKKYLKITCNFIYSMKKRGERENIHNAEIMKHIPKLSGYIILLSLAMYRQLCTCIFF